MYQINYIVFIFLPRHTSFVPKKYFASVIMVLGFVILVLHGRQVGNSSMSHPSPPLWLHSWSWLNSNWPKALERWPKRPFKNRGMCTVVHARALTCRQSATLIKRFFFQVERTARLLFLWKMEVWLISPLHQSLDILFFNDFFDGENYRYSVCTNQKEVKQTVTELQRKKSCVLVFLTGIWKENRSGKNSRKKSQVGWQHFTRARGGLFSSTPE